MRQKYAFHIETKGGFINHRLPYNVRRWGHYDGPLQRVVLFLRLWDDTPCAVMRSEWYPAPVEGMPDHYHWDYEQEDERRWKDFMEAPLPPTQSERERMELQCVRLRELMRRGREKREEQDNG